MTVRINMVQGKCTVINMTTIVLSAKGISCALACGDWILGVQRAGAGDACF
jgi:hypothetical protein